MQFFLAWADSTDTTFSALLGHNDENVFSFTITHSEGDCAQLSIVIRNPKVGLLSTGRKVWAWLSYSDGIGPAAPLFFGRLYGIPDMKGSDTGFAETVTLTFVAKPVDFVDQRRALAESLAVLPYYDPLFIDSDYRINPSDHTGDVDTVLEAYSSRWHCSRGADGSTLTVTTSDSNVGEDGTEIFTPGDGVDPSSISMSIDGTPVTSATVKASVSWTENAATGTPIKIGDWVINTYSGSDIVSNWPSVGSTIGGNWMAADGTAAEDLYGVDKIVNSNINYTWKNTAKSHHTGDAMSITHNLSLPVCKGPSIEDVLYKNSQAGFVWSRGGGYDLDLEIANDDDDVNIPLHYDATTVTVPQSRVQASLYVLFADGRGRTESIDFTMDSDVQSVLTDPSDYDTSSAANPPDETILEITGDDPTKAITVGDDPTTEVESAPLSDPSYPSYFATDRGNQSALYLMLRARALLLAGARLVKISWDIPFSRAILLSCRKNATLLWSKLPGGYVSGKITEYTISADGDGNLGGTVTIMATVGNGIDTSNQYSDVAGTGSYVEDGYVIDGYQTRDGQIVTISGGDLAFTPVTIDTTAAESATLTGADIVQSVNLSGSLELQRAAILDAIRISKKDASTVEEKQNLTTSVSELIAAAMKENPISLEIVLKSADACAADMEMTEDTLTLLVPKTIDLAAASL